MLAIIQIAWLAYLSHNLPNSKNEEMDIQFYSLTHILSSFQTFFLGFSSKVCSKGFKLQRWNDKSRFLTQFQSLNNLLRLWHFILSRVLSDSSSCIYCMKKKQSIKSSMLQMVRWQKTLREWNRCWHYQIGFLLQILVVLAFLWEVENCWPLRKDHTQICDESGMRQQSPNLQVSLNCWYCLIRLQHKRREGLKSSLIIRITSDYKQ